MDTLLDIFFLPPMAVARLGSGQTPLESFEWAQDPAAHGGNRTVLEPAITLEVLDDGRIRPYLPDADSIRFKDDDGGIRPVAPFFELWARMQAADDGHEYETPLTPDLLHELGIALDHVRYRITAGNTKAARRTGDAACGFSASVTVAGDDHAPHELRAFSRHTARQRPLVPEDRPIGLGWFRVIRPAAGIVGPEQGLPEPVDTGILRVRYTPPPGRVYGPPDAVAGPATLAVPGYRNDPGASEYGRIHEIVPPENRILNGDTPWSDFAMMTGLHDDPEPHDSYDGARVGDNRSWGVVDDTSDGIIEAELVIDGQRHRAMARFFTGPPDFAPDTRPFYSLVDDLEDRDTPEVQVDEENFETVKAEVLDLFRRVYETNRLMNLDAVRAQALKDNAALQARSPTAALPGLPSTGPRSMTVEDATPVRRIGHLISPQPPAVFSRAVARDRLPYTRAVPFVHDQFIDEARLLDFLRRHGERMKALVRPPFGLLSEFDEQPGPEPNPDFRDPRVARDMLHDMRMPPYMRDCNYFPLSLSRRQYRLLMQFVELLESRS